MSGVRVTFDGETWKCDCSRLEPDVPCTHIEQAQRFRQLRCNRPEARPIQLAFDGLGLPARLRETSPNPHLAEDDLPPPVTTPITRPSRRSAAVMATLLAGVLLSTLAYFSTEPPPVIATAAVAAPRPTHVEQHQPFKRSLAPTVKLVNPFDPTETFEFPPGTSDDEARDTAAAFLLNRARERLATAADRDHTM